MELFSEILSDLIFHSGLSLRKLEKLCGVSAVQLGKYSNGVSYPNIDVAMRLANYFECSLDYLFGLTEKKAFKDEIKYDLTKFVARYEKLLSENKTTHYKFAKANNLSESCLRHWKYGQIPKISSLFIIAKGFGVSIDYLIGAKNK